jgi:hypothetical protein
MWEDCRAWLANAKQPKFCKFTHEKGLAVLLEVRLISIHHAVQPWQELPKIKSVDVLAR